MTRRKMKMHTQVGIRTLKLEKSQPMDKVEAVEVAVIEAVEVLEVISRINKSKIELSK